MSEQKHTPGPWFFEEPTGDVTSEGADLEVCMMVSRDADGRLIAAAPDLGGYIAVIVFSGWMA